MSNKEIKQTKAVRWAENPFLGSDGQVINSRKKRVVLGKSNNVLLNTETGETETAHVCSFHEVDDAMFIKLFTQNITAMLDLTAAGNKAFVFLSWTLQKYCIGRDIVPLGSFELNDFLSHNNVKMSEPTMRRGLSELVKAKIIAHTQKQGSYYINPHFVFNGDRIRFVTEIRRKRRNIQDEMEAAGQQRLID